MPRVCVDISSTTTVVAKKYVDNEYQTWYRSGFLKPREKNPRKRRGCGAWKREWRLGMWLAAAGCGFRENEKRRGRLRVARLPTKLKPFPRGLEANDFAGFMYGLKPVPFMTAGLSAN
jgi:hypothetical protein